MKQLIVVAMMLPAALSAQRVGPPQAEIVAERQADAAMDNGRYLDAVDVLRPFAVDTRGNPSTGLGGQMYRQYAGWVSGGIPDPNKQLRPLEPADAKALGEAELRDAIHEIVLRARRTRVVILNEDHSSPRSRAFALELATALRPLGYGFLAAETLANDADDAKAAAAMTAFTKDGYVRRKTGFYSQDPTFAAFLRGALQLGYRPVAYEAVGQPNPSATSEQQLEYREDAEANFLISRVLKAAPEAKLLVYVGFSHLAEAPLKDGNGIPVRWMAAWLRAKTGIDPLTIDQTEWLEDPTFSRTAGFAAIADRIATSPTPTRSVVLFSGGKPLVLGDYAGAVDMQVAHPRTLLVNGRPDWLASMGLKPVVISTALRPVTGRRLVQAFGVKEADDAVPMDQIVVMAGKSQPALMLPPGSPMRLVTQDARTNNTGQGIPEISAFPEAPNCGHQTYGAVSCMASIATDLLWLMAVAGLTSCSKQGENATPNKIEWQRAGWHYTFVKDDWGAAVYRFSNGSSAKTFVALCDGSPSFLLTYPGFDPLAHSFTVQINGRNFSQPHYFPQHSDGLNADDPKFARYFAEARGDIVFRVGKTWSVKVPSSPYLARLVSECSARNAKSKNVR